MRTITTLSLAFALAAGLAVQGCARSGSGGAAARPSDSTAVGGDPIRADTTLTDTTADTTKAY